MKPIEVQLSKTKIFLMLLGSIAFVIISILGIVNPEKYISVIFRNPIPIFISSVAGLLFFGFTTYSIIRHLYQRRIGLIINDDGIIDNSSGNSAGMILWKDIKSIDAFEVVNQKFIRIIVKNPDEYINRHVSSMKRKIAAANHKKYGSPVQISANSLKIKFDELYELLQSKFTENRL